mmetsp:Transcript_13982/g.24748  ORF Transcript_13982/g.24748 Transcript_13982/m.24748 type:complete len:200 (-) Transcript_13982:2170-2769(-)
MNRHIQNDSPNVSPRAKTGSQIPTLEKACVDRIETSPRISILLGISFFMTSALGREIQSDFAAIICSQLDICVRRPSFRFSLRGTFPALLLTGFPRVERGSLTVSTRTSTFNDSSSETTLSNAASGLIGTHTSSSVSCCAIRLVRSYNSAFSSATFTSLHSERLTNTVNPPIIRVSSTLGVSALGKCLSCFLPGQGFFF